MENLKNIAPKLKDESLRLMIRGFICTLFENFTEEGAEELRLILNEAHNRGISLIWNED